jgi:predicted dehydrogenase
MVGGSKRMVVYDDIEPTEKIRLYDSGVELSSASMKDKAKFLYRMGDILIPNLPAVEALAQMVEHFRTCIESGVAPVTDGYFGLKVVGLLDAATRSVAANGQPVYLE